MSDDYTKTKDYIYALYSHYQNLTIALSKQANRDRTNWVKTRYITESIPTRHTFFAVQCLDKDKFSIMVCPIESWDDFDIPEILYPVKMPDDILIAWRQLESCIHDINKDIENVKLENLY